MNLCDCDSDGFCQRYQRNMSGRFREICAGINVDLGTAAAFREQWSREAGWSHMTYCKQPQKLLLRTRQAPGDAVAMTAAVYSLHKAHPGKFVTAVESLWTDVFENNPDVSMNLTTEGDTLTDVDGYANVEMHYPAIHQSNDRGIHFMQGWCEFLGSALGISLPLLTNRPHLYFTDPDPPVEDLWLICSGGKSDFTTKLWGHKRYQQVVEFLRGEVHFVQVGSNNIDHSHERLDDTTDMVGKTTLRELFNLVRIARGVVCGVSLLMHVAAALGKPAIVVAGGREPVPWNTYPRQHYLHTVGALPCHDVRGHKGVACWRYRTVPLGNHPVLDKDTCERPVDGVPDCMRMINPWEVAILVSRYNRQYEHATDSK